MYAITELQHAEKEPVELNIRHDGKKTMLKFSNSADLQAVTTFLSAQKKFTYKTHQLSLIKAIQSQLIGVGLILLFGWVLYSEAQTIEAGGSIDTSGRRALTKRLMAWVAETLGSQGVLIVSGVALAACGYYIYRNLKTPPNQVVYA
ncbi:hypothetical protein [Paraflavitalea speifideaquila]|uniref:hypothetical protein n=1 Tax=Paraflavitalea speifideaquila TaxID=3076558 RepID=UPI0028ECEE32|nr:hypothetical protein [Paraflavitalea speifideiaquila]